MSRIYTTKTPSLKATIADIRNLDAKKINLKGKDILEHIKESVPTIKHSQDTRETVTEDDLWGQWAETKSDGTIIVHDNWVTNPNASSSSAWNTSITKVEDNKSYTSSGFYANIQTEKIKDGKGMFSSCKNLTTFSSNLLNLMNGYGMFYYCSNLTSFSSDLSSLTDGYNMFYYCSNLTSFSTNLSRLTDGGNMFFGCTNLTSFSSDMPSLTDGSSMFYGCKNLKSFSSDLSSLMGGFCMFQNCSGLNIFSSDLPSLTDGSSMFYKCSNLTSFTSALSSLTYSSSMFLDCSNLTSFSSDMHSLVDGGRMFEGCSNLTSFTSYMSSLTTGGNMFKKCKLDAQSVMYIYHSIKDITAEKQLYINNTIPYVTYDFTTDKYSAPRGFMDDGIYVYTYKKPNPFTTTISASFVGKITIGIDVTDDSSTIQQQLKDFANEAAFDSWDDLKTHFSNKGWTVTFQYGGTTDTIPDEFPNTYGLRGGERIIPCPIFAKLVQVEDKDSAEYCTEDASTFYNIEWGHDVTNPQDFQQFDSLEDAMRTFNVFPKENIIVTEE